MTVTSQTAETGQVRHAMLRIGLANLGFGQALYASLIVILPGRATVVGGSDAKTSTLAIVAATGAIIALVGAITIGNLSDRLFMRSGTRHPVLLFGAVLASACLVMVPHATTLPLLVLIWCAVQVGLSGVVVAITTALVDWFGTSHRGRASAFAAAGQVVGTLIAGGLAIALGSRLSAIAAISGVVLLFAALPAARSGRTALTRDLPDSGLVNLRPSYRDVGLAWAVRAVVTFSNALVFTFISFYAVDVLSAPEPERFTGLAASVASTFVVVGAVLSGRASDRLGRRRIFVNGAVGLMAVGQLLLAAVDTDYWALVACSVVGIGYGVYLAVDQALTVEVLPDSKTYGRDVGIMNTSAAAPQIAAPVCAALLLGASSNYGLLFGVGALVTLFGALFVTLIRSVR